jgi:hypothetical protein
MTNYFVVQHCTAVCKQLIQPTVERKLHFVQNFEGPTTKQDVKKLIGL